MTFFSKPTAASCSVKAGGFLWTALFGTAAFLLSPHPGWGDTISATGSEQTYTTTTAGVYEIVAYGAQGGGPVATNGGNGAEIGADFKLGAGVTLDLFIGEQGGNGSEGQIDGQGDYLSGGGGGGGTFVVLNGSSVPLLVAGGGGGAGRSGGSGGQISAASDLGGSNDQDGGGGGGFGSAGSSGIGSECGLGTGIGGGAFPSFSGGVDSQGGGFGGYGGGSGGGYFCQTGGGGGGYSGGNAGLGGQGGGSYLDASGTNSIEVAGENGGNGFIKIQLITAAPEPAPLALFGLGVGVISLGFVRRRG